MKKTLTIVFVIIIWGTYLIAQNDLTKPYDISNGDTIISEKEQNNMFIGVDITERIITTSIIIGELILLLVVIFYWKKSKGENSIKNKSVIKNNIRAIRDEQIKPIINKKVSYKRRTLKNKLTTKKINGKNITTTAKKLAISKGELFLAIKIQQLHSQVR